MRLFFVSVLAPNGCLQYYKSVSGTVMSFNYGTTENTRGTYNQTSQQAINN